MQDHNGDEISIGNLVYQLNGDPAAQLVVVEFDGDLVVCSSPPPAEGFNFPSDPEGQPPRPYVPDKARMKFSASDLVRV